MKIPTLISMIAMIGVMLLGIWLLHRDPSPASTQLAPGDPLITFDLNDLGELHIQRGQDHVVLAVHDGRWVIPAAYNYPANFSRLAGELRGLMRVQVGQMIRGGEELLHEFGLDPDSERQEERPYLTLSFRDHDQQTLGILRVGKARRDPREAQARPGFMPEGAYMRLDEGPVVLTTESLRMFPANQDELIQSRLFELSLEDIRMLRLNARTGQNIAIEQSDAGEFIAPDLDTNEELNMSRARQWFHSFRFVNLADVAGPRHEDIPEAFLEDYDQLEIETVDGRLITLRIGEPSPDLNPYLTISILDVDSGEPHADDAEFSGWTLTLPTHLHSQLIVDREDLVTPIDIGIE